MNQEYKIFNEFSDLGSFLKEHREIKGLNLKDVSKEIFIKEDMLAKFEEGNIDIENFNNSPYLKGFLNTYIKYLNLDKVCKLELSDRKKISNLQKSNLQLEMSSSKRASYGSIIVLLSFIMIGSIYLLWSKNTYINLYLIGTNIK